MSRATDGSHAGDADVSNQGDTTLWDLSETGLKSCSSTIEAPSGSVCYPEQGLSAWESKDAPHLHGARDRVLLDGAGRLIRIERDYEATVSTDVAGRPVPPIDDSEQVSRRFGEIEPPVVKDRLRQAATVQLTNESVALSDEDRIFGKWGARSKRAFDVLASLAVLVATLPVSAVIACAIWIQAGRPVLFSNERQTKDGRGFQCLKFRTMRRDAEQIKATFTDSNTCDGPQFHIPNDPRTFPIGRVLRRCHLDELPQLINVLKGDMSIVGPRPSPHSENQCCPAWRRERLSVRAGITGLWQVNCKRKSGTDFQEWIRYDLEYIRGWSWRLDLSIMCRTLMVAVRRGLGLFVPPSRVGSFRTPKAAVYTPESPPRLVEPKPAGVAHPTAESLSTAT